MIKNKIQTGLNQLDTKSKDWIVLSKIIYRLKNSLKSKNYTMTNSKKNFTFIIQLII